MGSIGSIRNTPLNSEFSTVSYKTILNVLVRYLKLLELHTVQGNWPETHRGKQQQQCDSSVKRQLLSNQNLTKFP